MSRISTAFEKKGSKALIPYLTVGYPDVNTTLKTVEVLAASGADVVELGIPFSDPMADGATIQDSSYHSLQAGVTTETCMQVARQIRQQSAIPLVFMTYYNPIFAYGIERFCRDSIECGIDGLIVPDLPPEESRDLDLAAHAAVLDLIYLLAPTSSEERIRLIAKRSHGYIYLVSVAGVTGARQALPPDLAKFVARVRKVTQQPLCVGFGISSPEQAGYIAGIADGVIIGSKIIQLIKSDPTLKELAAFTRKTKKMMNSCSVSSGE
jgi:tryptophan synthase alpha chain